MSSGKRREPRTKLDKNVRDGFIDGQLAHELRKIYLRWEKNSAPAKHPKDYQTDYEMLTCLLCTLMEPARPSARKVDQRDYWISKTLAYNKALGDPRARKKTADQWGEHVRTVDRADRKHRCVIPKTIKKYDEQLREELDRARDDFGGPKAKSKTRSDRLGHQLH